MNAALARRRSCRSTTTSTCPPAAGCAPARRAARRRRAARARPAGTRLAAGGGDDAVVGRALGGWPSMPSPNTRRTLREPQAAPGCSRALSCRRAQPLDRRHLAAPPAPAPRPGSRSRCRSRARGRGSPRAARVRAAEQQLDHARHHRGLGDRLAVADRQAGVFVGLVDERAVDEAMARHRGQRAQHRARRRRPAPRSRCTMRARTVGRIEAEAGRRGAPRASACSGARRRRCGAQRALRRVRCASRAGKRGRASAACAPCRSRASRATRLRASRPARRGRSGRPAAA